MDIMKKYFVTVIIILCSSFVFSQAPDSSLMKPAVFDWNNIKVEPTKTGEKRQIFNSTTPTMANLECHVTTLNPGETAHPPHQHPEDEMIIVKEGTVEVLADGQLKRVGTGSVIFQASNYLHNIKNVGTTKATYYAIKWRVKITAEK